MMDLQSLVSKVISLSKEVGDFILEEAERFDPEKIEHKGFNDLVSYVDKEAERRLVSSLQKVLPQAGFIAEEGTSTKKGDEFNWIVDPLDGTTNFTHGLPVFAISIALMQNDEIILGVVYELNRQECFHAIKGGNAYCNKKIIQVSKVNELSGSLLATGFPYYNFERMQSYLAIIDAFMQKTHGLRRMGSAAVDLVYVACGRFEGFFEYNLNAWDVAAGAYIVQQAGGSVSDFKGGNDYIFGKEIVASCHVQKDMLKVIQSKW